MVRAIALVAVTLFCILMRHIECAPKPLIVDTPDLFNKLKHGHFNGKYRDIEITSQATSDVLLQPQYFAKAPFSSLKFISTDGNWIQIHPAKTYSLVYVTLVNGENSLSGVPNDYALYYVTYNQTSKPTTENIDSILQWTRAIKISIQDHHDIAFSLFKRITELEKFTMLLRLDLHVQRATVEQIQAASFIKHLRRLTTLVFGGNDELSGPEILEKCPAPNKWRGTTNYRYAFYLRKEWEKTEGEDIDM